VGGLVRWLTATACQVARKEKNELLATEHPNKSMPTQLPPREYTRRRRRFALALRWVCTRHIMKRMVIPRFLSQSASYDRGEQHPTGPRFGLVSPKNIKMTSAVELTFWVAGATAATAAKHATATNAAAGMCGGRRRRGRASAAVACTTQERQRRQRGASG